MTLVSGSLQAIGAASFDFLGRSWSFRGVSGALLYLLGVMGEILELTSIYLVMLAGRIYFLDNRESVTETRDLRSQAAEPRPNIEYFNKIGQKRPLTD